MSATAADPANMAATLADLDLEDTWQLSRRPGNLLITKP